MCTACGLPSLHHGLALPRRDVLALGLGAAAMFGLPAFAAEDAPPPKPQNVIPPAEALERLQAGNKRYVEGVAKRHDFIAEREALVGGQNPFASILSCADSRVAPEYAFDTSRGDLFVVRVAGNFINTDNLASFEYAVAVLKTPLILVLGHEACGAVKAAISAVKDGASFPGHIQDLTTALAPAVKAVLDRPGDLLENATVENVRQNVAALKAATPILSAAVADKSLAIAGGIYRLATGGVDIIA
ncbi:carbonic anhydrase [Methylovirgula ligni]|uniref:Carbonic anhydrase n=1 Tax=Methylovirgula ligni TaxID=569860 RepID=A0A3D9YYQ2_9HYPH|nr:carbonic anhydrase [Methylovirgula ligni]REF87495.1 carbonic anhydrase [Methylovirgula ligni]